LILKLFERGFESRIFPASPEVNMNCQSCNTRINYRFLTNCAHCGRAVEPAGLPEVDSTSALESSDTTPKRLSWKKQIVNLAYVFAGSVVGMISGAVVVYYSAAMVYIAVYSGVDENHSAACARGMAIGLLSVLSGAFVGIMSGTAFTVKHPLFKAQNH
jgi:hypothetical protein